MVAKHDAPPAADSYELIRGLARAAFDGDARAAYLIAREYERCGIPLVYARDKEDPEAVADELARHGWQGGKLDRMIVEVRRCFPLQHQDPFVDLPPRPQGYPAAYWLDRSAEAGYPLAMVAKGFLLRVPPNVSNATDADRERAELTESQGRAMLLKAALSRDPDVLLDLGFKMGRQASLVEDDQATLMRAAAWMLMACRTGAQCGFDSEIVPLSQCPPENVLCTPGLNVDFALSHVLGPEKYARAYSLSQELEEQLNSNDAEGVKAFLDFPMTRSPP